MGTTAADAPTLAIARSRLGRFRGAAWLPSRAHGEAPALLRQGRGLASTFCGCDEQDCNTKPTQLLPALHHQQVAMLVWCLGGGACVVDEPELNPATALDSTSTVEPLTVDPEEEQCDYCPLSTFGNPTRSEVQPSHSCSYIAHSTSLLLVRVLVSRKAKCASGNMRQQ